MNDTTQTQILQSFSDALVSMVGTASNSVVHVNTSRGLGTGVIWDKEGHIVTANHVVGRSTRVDVSFVSGERFSAKTVGQDRLSDIAVLQIDDTPSKLVPLERGESGNVATGQFVVALANGFGERVSAASGIVTNPAGNIGGQWSDNLVITDVRLNRGYSGGPLIDASGKMIGMNVAVFANRGIALPVDLMTTIVAELSNSGTLRRAYLGIVSNPVVLPNEIARDFGQAEALIVLSVEPGSPARRAGVAVGDVILGLDSKQVQNYYDLHRLLSSGVIGRSIKLSILRSEKPEELTITPVEA